MPRILCAHLGLRYRPPVAKASFLSLRACYVYNMLRSVLVNLGIVALVVFPTIVVSLGFSLARGDSEMLKNHPRMLNGVFLGVTEIELIDKDPPYNREVRLYWVEAPNLIQAKKELNKGLADQWGKFIRTHKVVDVIPRDDWAGHGLRFIGEAHSLNAIKTKSRINSGP